MDTESFTHIFHFTHPKQLQDGDPSPDRDLATD